MERFGAGILLPLCVLLSEWCVRFGAGMVVPLECHCKLLVQGCLLSEWCVCSLERAGWWLSGCCCRCCLKVMLEGAAVRVASFKTCFGAGMLVSGCRWGCCRASLPVLLRRWCLRVLQGGYVMYPTRAARVLVKGAAARCCCCRVQLLEWRVSVLELACWCRSRVLLQGAAVKVVCALWSWHVSCHCRMPLQDAAEGFFSEAAGGLERGEWLRRKDLCSQDTSSDLANVPRFRLGKFEVWFGYGLGYDSETHFFWILEALLLESLFFHRQPTTIAT